MPPGVFLGRLGHGGVLVSGGRCTFDAVAPTSACKVQISSSDPLSLLGAAGLARAVNFVPGEQRAQSRSFISTAVLLHTRSAQPHGVVHARVRQIVTFGRYGFPACP